MCTAWTGREHSNFGSAPQRLGSLFLSMCNEDIVQGRRCHKVQQLEAPSPAMWPWALHAPLSSLPELVMKSRVRAFSCRTRTDLSTSSEGTLLSRQQSTGWFCHIPSFDEAPNEKVLQNEEQLKHRPEARLE